MKTDRTINLDMIIDASPTEVYRLWTSSDGVKIGGYFLILARDLAAAVEISKSCPIFANGGTIEVRPIQQIPAHERSKLTLGMIQKGRPRSVRC